jgi:carbon-monoxide dehydrogenase large subunit
MSEILAERFTGTAVKRAEDPRILTGTGNYIDDVTVPGMLYAAFLRSTAPHARIARIDTSAARAAEGVVAVYTGEELEAVVQPGPFGIGIMTGGGGLQHSLLATDKVRLVGDLVALVVAESRYLAEDAVELIEVDYDDLPGIGTAAKALDPSLPAIFEALGSNVLNEPTVNEHGDVAGAFARADRVVNAHLEMHRHQNVPMETRGVVVDFDEHTGRCTVWASTQGVGMMRMAVATKLGISSEHIRVLTGDVGGSFGLKIGASREDIAIAAAAKDLGRPVKWIEDRYEHLAASGQAREESFDVEAAVTNEGDLLGLRVSMVVDTGAYPGMGQMLPSIVEGMVPGPYKIEALAFDSTAVVTNKASYVAYRGPWAAETWIRERMIDIIARELGQEPIDIRLRNVVDPAVTPATMVTGRSLAGVTAKESLLKVREMFDIEAFRARQRDLRAQGRYLGLGIATYIEAAPGPRGDAPVGAEQMRMRLTDEGEVVVYSGQMPHGQSHQTTIAQVVADEMGVPFESVTCIFGDTETVPFGFTGGSRAATMAGGASMMTARALRARVLEVAAHLFEASADDLEIVDGKVSVRGVPASAMTLGEVVSRARHEMMSGVPGPIEGEFEVEHVYDGGAGGWSGGTHLAAVEVDIETGNVTFERYLVAEDCGELINPAVVDGQVRGGVAQGVGAVLLERSAYDADAQFLASTFMDYLMPTTMEVPNIEIHHLEHVQLDPDVNFRGVGEGGMIVAPACINNAIEDALAPFGVTILEQHLPPARILELAGVVEPE